jgi:TorA maturation chaperone TorD
VWDLLARLYVSEPTAELVEGLRSSSLSGLFQQIDESRTEGVARETGEESLDDLVEDYTALFLGPGPHQSPHESVQTSEDAGKGLLWGQVTVEVKAFMEGAGLVLPEETSLIPDHISVELQFLARLAEAEARRSRSDRVLASCLGRHRQVCGADGRSAAGADPGGRGSPCAGECAGRLRRAGIHAAPACRAVAGGSGCGRSLRFCQQ